MRDDWHELRLVMPMPRGGLLQASEGFRALRLECAAPTWMEVSLVQPNDRGVGHEALHAYADLSLTLLQTEHEQSEATWSLVAAGKREARACVGLEEPGVRGKVLLLPLAGFNQYGATARLRTALAVHSSAPVVAETVVITARAVARALLLRARTAKRCELGHDGAVLYTLHDSVALIVVENRSTTHAVRVECASADAPSPRAPRTPTSARVRLARRAYYAYRIQTYYAEHRSTMPRPNVGQAGLAFLVLPSAGAMSRASTLSAAVSARARRWTASRRGTSWCCAWTASWTTTAARAGPPRSAGAGRAAASTYRPCCAAQSTTSTPSEKSASLRHQQWSL